MTRSFTVLNVDEGIYEAEFSIDAQSVDVAQGAAEWSVRLQRLHGGLSEGVDVIWLDNGCTKLAILPTRGMGIWKAQVADTPLEWKSPVERPVHPSFVDQSRRGGIGWLDGFNELICRCGLGWHGAPGTDVVTDADGNVLSEQFLPLHGRIANLAAHQVRVEVSDDGAISVIGVVDEASMFGGKLRLTSTLTTHIGSTTFEVSDTVQNLGSAPAEVEMLYHCNIGQPFLGEGATFHLAAEEVAPRDARAAEDTDTWTTYLKPTSGYTEQCYFAKPITDDDGRSLAVLQNPAGSKAVAVRFDAATLPWLTLWKNTQPETDGYVTGIEPGSSFPNLKTFERQHGRVISLESQQSVTFDLSISVATDEDDTAKLTDEVTELQTRHDLKLHTVPHADWSQ
ncbi:MAG: aldose 1-epimerase family protein [Fuerstiella sp.]